MATKSRELSNPNSCLNRAADDEPLFILRAQDLTADGLVEQWANRAAKRGVSAEKVAGARAISVAMRAWPHRKVPD